MPPAVGVTYTENTSSRHCADGTEIHPGREKHSFCSVRLVPLVATSPPIRWSVDETEGSMSLPGAPN